MSVDGHERVDGYQPLVGSKDDCVGYHLNVHLMKILGKSTYVHAHDISTHEILVNGTLDSYFLEPSEKSIFPLAETYPLGRNLVLNLDLSKTSVIGNPTSCLVLFSERTNSASSFEFLMGDLKCKGKDRGT